MKKAAALILSGVLLAGCTSGPAEPKVEEVEEVEENKPTQEELNAQLKAEAEEIGFVEANAGEVEPGAKVKKTGTASTIIENVTIEFLLQTEESESGFGSFYVKGFNVNETPIEEGQEVTVYGTYNGKNESGLPEIAVTIIE